MVLEVSESKVVVFFEFNDAAEVEKAYSYEGRGYTQPIEDLFNSNVRWIDENFATEARTIEELTVFKVELSIELLNYPTYTGTHDYPDYEKGLEIEDLEIKDLFEFILDEVEFHVDLNQSEPAVVEHRKSSSKHKHRTSTGIYVRSKAEAIVAETLTRLGLQFEYEKQLCNPGDPRDIRLPDFTIYHDGETYYWEHLGMLSEPEYKHNWDAKLKWYIDCGFGKQLITSEDAPDGSIDSYTIEQTARARILS